jgi:hypothetical protein
LVRNTQNRDLELQLAESRRQTSTAVSQVEHMTIDRASGRLANMFLAEMEPHQLHERVDFTKRVTLSDRFTKPALHYPSINAPTLRNATEYC